MRTIREHYCTIRIKLFENINRFFLLAKKYQCFFIMYFVAGFAAYSLMISENLVNSGDGIKYNSVMYAGDLERSSGRWLIPVIDKIRYGIASTPLNTILTLILISCGCILIIDLFKVRHKISAFLVGSVYIISPLICCSLSYAYTSVSFGVAFLLSVAAAYATLKIPHTPIAILAGGFLIAFSMGAYQAYFGVFCVILLIFLINCTFRLAERKKIVNIVIRAGGTILTGGLLYKIIVSVDNAAYDVELSGYRGIDSISLKSIILNLPQRIQESYREFYEFFFTHTIQNNNFGLRYVNFALLVIFLCIFISIIVKIFKSSLIYGLLGTVEVICIPIACNATLLLTVDEGYLPMMGGTVLLFPLLLCIVDEFLDGTILRSVFILGICGLLWVNICIVNNDQIAMNEGKTATATIAENVITTLIQEGYLDPDSDFTFAIIGKPYGNEMFYCSDSMKRANTYAQFGIKWDVGGNNDRRSWRGLIRQYCGISLNFCTNEIYYEILDTEDFQKMPNYPAGGSVQEINNVVVVKISDMYR